MWQIIQRQATYKIIRKTNQTQPKSRVGCPSCPSCVISFHFNDTTIEAVCLWTDKRRDSESGPSLKVYHLLPDLTLHQQLPLLPIILLPILLLPQSTKLRIHKFLRLDPTLLNVQDRNKSYLTHHGPWKEWNYPCVLVCVRTLLWRLSYW